MLNDKIILITGGTGSLGKKLTQMILTQYKPKKLIIFSRDELKQHEMAQKWNTATYPCIRYFIGDVRDKERLIRAFHGVDYVIHAAALKQVPAAEYNPVECIRTNVMGAMNVIDAALENNVQRVVALSTDKACNPINLYGATKLCSDKLFIAANAYSSSADKIFSVVRYGNVVGSRGSVVPFFREKMKEGVIPITDSRMTRFWITIDQAAHFVLKVLSMARGYEIFVPKIPSMRITDLATAVAPHCEQRAVGLRPGEKIHELLIARDDARNALETDAYYILLPQGRMNDDYYAQTKRCPENFEYGSATNSWFLTIEDLQKIVARMDNDTFIEESRWGAPSAHGAVVYDTIRTSVG